jgi:reverse gyrase
MNFTISKRQEKLYNARNFDLRKWEVLIDDGNALRKEIKAVANEYDVEWDELQDENSQKVHEALREERKRKKEGKSDKDDDEPKSKKD